MLTDESKCSRRLFLVDLKFCHVLSKLSIRSCEKNCCRQQKVIGLFSLFKEKTHRRDLVIHNFFSSTTQNTCWFAVCQNSHRPQKVIDERKSSTRKSYRKHLLLCVYSFRNIITDDDSLVFLVLKVDPS